MISIVVCSINPSLASNLQISIANTIGLEFEMIIIDNRLSNKSIGTVYNEGALKATYPYVCFVHEDVVFTSQNWGKTLLRYFTSNDRLGLVGVAGAKYKSITNSGWYTGSKTLDCVNIFHVDKNGKEKKIISMPSSNSLIEKVVCIDGVFMCSTKNAWQANQFNEQILNGFHFYDIDFSLRISNMYETIVTSEIDMIHLTEGGSFSNNWMHYSLLWHTIQNEKKYLPQTLPELDQNQFGKYELSIAKTWLKFLMKSDVTFWYRIKWLCNLEMSMYFRLLSTIIPFLFYQWAKPLIKIIKRPKQTIL